MGNTSNRAEKIAPLVRLEATEVYWTEMDGTEKHYDCIPSNRRVKLYIHTKNLTKGNRVILQIKDADGRLFFARGEFYRVAGDVDANGVLCENVLLRYKDDPGERFQLAILEAKETPFVPLGIKNTKKKDNSVSEIEIEYEIRHNAAQEYEISIYDKDSQLLWTEAYIQETIVRTEKENTLANNILTIYNPMGKESYPPGKYTFKWDGFDMNNIYDSTRMLEGLTFKISGKSSGGNKSETKATFYWKYAEEDYVDVRIDRNCCEVEVTLRIDFRDGGEKGLSPGQHIGGSPYSPSYNKPADWDMIPQSEINRLGYPPLKARTKTYAQLIALAIDGVNHYWSRNSSKAQGKDVTIDGRSYQVRVWAVDAKNKCTDDIKLIFLTNYDRSSMFNRSSNPGKARDWYSFWANVATQKIFYEVGYNYSYINGSINCNYITETKAITEFLYTAAHEVGHEILSAFGGGEYSVKHKGTSTFFQDPISPSTLPATGEVDLMKYYDFYDFPRTTAAEEDVIGLIWLAKIKID